MQCDAITSQSDRISIIQLYNRMAQTHSRDLNYIRFQQKREQKQAVE